MRNTLAGKRLEGTGFMTDTSLAAYDSILPHASRLARQVYGVIARGGATCEECETALGMKHQTASARIRELKDKHLVRDSGRRRKTTSGRLAAVMVVYEVSSDCKHDRTKWIDEPVNKRYGWLRTECECGQFMGYRDKRNDVKNHDIDI